MSDATETRHKPRAILADAEREEAFAAIADPENGAGREVLRRIADKIGRTRRPGALSDIPAGATYLAQFAVHDLDLRGREDVSGAPRLDLALIYGDGPRHDAFAYQAPDGPGDPRRMLRMGRTRPTGDSPAWGAARDLPRVGCPHLDAHGVDARSEVLIPNAFSDSNLLLGQMQTIWAMLHNLVVQRLAAADRRQDGALGAGDGLRRIERGGDPLRRRDDDPVVVAEDHVAGCRVDAAAADGRAQRRAREGGARSGDRAAGEDRQPEPAETVDVAAEAVDHDPGESPPPGLGREQLPQHRKPAPVGGDHQDVAGLGVRERAEHGQVVVLGHDRERCAGHPYVGHHRPHGGVHDGEGLVGVAQRGDLDLQEPLDHVRCQHPDDDTRACDAAPRPGSPVGHDAHLRAKRAFHG